MEANKPKFPWQLGNWYYRCDVCEVDETYNGGLNLLTPYMRCWCCGEMRLVGMRYTLDDCPRPKPEGAHPWFSPQPRLYWSIKSLTIGYKCVEVIGARLEDL